MKLDVVILAAGKGSRMRSKLPKVLHPIGGQPMLSHVLTAAAKLKPRRALTVVGHGADQVQQIDLPKTGQWVVQTEQLGTGHAVAQCLPYLGEEGVTLILYGDVPLIRAETLVALVEKVSPDTLGLLTLQVADPSGYGRIVRNAKHEVTAIVEHKDASEAELTIQEVNTGILAVSSKDLGEWLPKLSSDNAQGEYYLTDIIGLAVASGKTVETLGPMTAYEVSGVNDRVQLAELERHYQKERAQQLMQAGATLINPQSLCIRGEVNVGEDVLIDNNVILEGQVSIASDVIIGANVIIKDSIIGAGTRIEPNSHIEGAVIGEQCSVGPFARLRPGTVMGAQSKAGNFVEIKKSSLGAGSKVNHLSYIGDSEVGSLVNIGAGVITCNYDGANKNKTHIGDNAFIGSNVSLVAPVVIGTKATIAAGSTITKDVPDAQLSIARSRQTEIENWSRPPKKKGS